MSVTGEASAGRTPRQQGEEQSLLAVLEGMTSEEPQRHELEFVARVARYGASARLITAIASRPKWYGCWEVREALGSNPATPADIREPIGTSFAVIELIREMDTPDLTEEERHDIREDARSLIRNLPQVDKRLVEERVRRLAVRKARPESPAEAPPHAPVTSPADKEALAPEAAPAEAPSESDFFQRLTAFFAIPPGTEERLAEARSLYEAIQSAPPPVRARVIDAFGHNWREFVQEVLDALPHAPARPVIKREPAPSAEPAEPVEEAGAAEPGQEPTADYSPPEEAPEPEPAPAEFDSHVVEDERAELARTTRTEEELAHLAYDADENVFQAFLDNPVASEEQVAALSAKVTREKVHKIALHSKWFAKPRVRDALLQNPRTPESVALRCLQHVGRLRALSRVMRDPRVRSLTVKAGARHRMVERYRAMSVDERVASIKGTGGQLLQDLWNEAFSDRPTLLKLVSDRGADEGIVLRIARARTAPRAVLMAIGQNPKMIANYQVCLELAQNPKTPREVLSRVVPRLNPADRARLRQNRVASDHLRRLAGSA